MSNSKQHDMLLAVLSKPDASSLDFTVSNITSENTQLLNREEYKASKYIQEQFTTDGKFNEDAFNNFYNLAQANFIELNEEQVLDNVSEDLQYGATSLFAPPQQRVTPDIKGHKFYNPLHQKIGIDGNYRSEAEITAKEAAQQNRIWNPATGQWLDETAESRSLLKKAFGEPLAYARYTEDTTINPVTGDRGNFKKGDFILDKDGNYFTQLAGSLDLSKGHEIVKLQDILTAENSRANKFDFFDADGLYKSPAGVATKMILSVAPYFLGPYFKIPYTILNIAVGLGSTLPHFVKAGNGIWSNQRYSELSESCNKIINYFERYKPSITEAGAQSFLSFENLGMMAVDTVNQLYGQRGVASLSKYLTKMPKAGGSMASLAETLSAQKKMSSRAQTLSAAYMTLLSVGDVYNQAIQSGYDDRTAGIATLMAAASMYGMVRFNAMSSWMLGPNQGYTNGVTQRATHTLAKDKYKALFDASQEFVQKGGSAKTKTKLVGAVNGLKKIWDESIRVGMGGLYRNMFTEGVEEVTEEVAVDAVKGLIDGLNHLGFAFDSNVDASFGGWNNVFSQKGLERYLQTFIGGAIGGGLFHTIDTKLDPKLNQFWTGKPDSRLQQEAKSDLIDIYFSGDMDGYIKELEHVSEYLPDQLMAIPDENGKLQSTPNKEISMRQFILDKLIEEAKITKANLDNYMKTVNPDLDKYPDFKVFLQDKFKADIRERNLEKFYEARYKRKVKQLFELKKVYEDYTKIYQEAEDTAKAEAKDKMELSKSRYEKSLTEMKRYFEGKSHADTYRIGQLLLAPEIVSFLKPRKENLTIEAFYKNFYVGDDATDVEYADLTPNAKESVKDAYDALTNDGSDLENFIQQADVLLSTVDVISDILSPSVTGFLRDARNSIYADRIHQEFDVLKQALEAINYEEALAGEITNWDSLSDAEKFSEVEYRKRMALIEAINPSKILQIIQTSPETMGSMEKLMIDYASIVTKFLPNYSSLNSATKKVIDNVINSVFSQHSTVAFTEDQIAILLPDIIQKITEDPIWKPALLQAEFGENYQEDDMLSVGIFDSGSYAQIASELSKAKLKTWMDMSKNGGLMDSFYDDIVEYKERVIGLFKDLLQNSHSQLADVFQVKTVDGVSYIKLETGQLAVLLAQLENNLLDDTTVPEDFAKLIKLFGLTYSSTLTSNDVIDAVNTLNERPEHRITNTLRNAITQLCLAAGVDGHKAITMAEFISDSMKRIRDGKASLVSIQSLPEHLKDSLMEMETVLKMVQVVGKMMAPIRYTKDVKVGSGTVTEEFEIDGMNKVRRDYMNSIGENTDNIHTMSWDEYLLFNSVLEQLFHQCSVLRSIHSNAEEAQHEQFENIRRTMFRNNYAIVKALNSIGVQAGEGQEDLFKFSEDELPLLNEVSATAEDKYKWTLTYKSLLQARLDALLAEGNLEKYGIPIEDGETTHSAIIKYVIENVSELVCDGNDAHQLTLFQYESDAVTASGGEAETVRISNMELGYVLTDLISIIPNQEKPSGITVQQIHNAIETALKQNPEFYPRQDQLYNIELALLSKFNYESANALSSYIEAAGQANPEANSRRLIYNYVRIPGPAGSGKSALWKLYIDALKVLQPDIKIAGTAHAESKVKDLANQINTPDRQSKHIPFSVLSTRIPKLATYQDLYQKAESQLLSELMVLQAKFGQESINVSSVSADTSITNWVERDGKLEYIMTVSETPSTPTSNQLTVTLSIQSYNGQYKLATDAARFEVNNTTIDEIVLTAQIDDIENGVLLLDECTNISTLEAQILDKIASTHNIQILATGDSVQEGYSISYTQSGHTEIHSVGDVDFIGINLPSLKSIHRAHNTGQAHNWSAYRKELDNAIRTSNKAEKSFQGLSNYTITPDAQQQLAERLPNIELQYTTQDNENGFLGTLTTAENSKFEETLNSIKDKEKRTVVGIVSNESDKQVLVDKLKGLGFKEENITVESVDVIKGVEADYAIGYNLKAEGNTFQHTVRMYTVMTRGRRGYLGLHVGNWKAGMNCKEAQIYTVRNMRSANDAGVQFLGNYRTIIDGLPNITLTTNNTDEIITDAEDTQVDEETSTEDNVQAVVNELLSQTSPETTSVDDVPVDDKVKEAIRKENTRIENAFGDHTVLPLHPMGFRTGIEVTILEKLRTTPIASALAELEKSANQGQNHLGDMRAIAQMFNGNFGQIYNEDLQVIKDIIAKAEAQYKKNFLMAYVYTINALRDAVYYGKVKRIAFWKTDYDGNYDHAFLKPNDDESTPTALYRFGIPVTDGSMITLATGGFIEYTGSNQDQKSAQRDELWNGNYNVYQLKKQSDRAQTDDSFKKLFDSTGENGKDKAQDDFYGRKMTGGVRVITSSRPLIPDVQLPKNRHNQRNGVVFLEDNETRPRVQAILDSGWTVVKDPATHADLTFEVDTTNANLLTDFTKFINKYRKAALTETEVKEKFSGILSHSGTYYVIQPVGRQDCMAFMYVNQVISWETWAKQYAFYSVKGKRSKNNYFSKYSTFQLLAALSDASINTWKYDIITKDFLQNLESKSETEIISTVKQAIENSNEWAEAVRTLGTEANDQFKEALLYSAVNGILKTYYPYQIVKQGGKKVPQQVGVPASIQAATKTSRTKSLVMGGKKPNPFIKNGRFGLTTLERNKPNYVFTSIINPGVDVTLYCGYLYEQERALLDLEAFEKVVGGVTQSSEPQTPVQPVLSETQQQKDLMNSLFVETVKTVRGKSISTVTCQSTVLQTLTTKQVSILKSGLNQLEDSKQSLYIKALQTAINSLQITAENTDLITDLNNLCK